jgi:hypothetical protein
VTNAKSNGFSAFTKIKKSKKLVKMNTLAVFLPCVQDGLLGKKAQIKVNLGTFITSSSTAL